MASRYTGVGRILFLCSHCGFVFHRYALGDPKNRSKYSGAPMPEQVLSGFDDVRCPRCGRRLSLKPLRIRVLSKAEFETRYVDMGFLILDRSVSRVFARPAVAEIAS